MKKITFILFALITGTTFAQPNNGTDNAKATATADVVSVIKIVKDVDLNFGKIITGTAGDVVIATTGTRTGTADIVTSTTTTAAKFSITAEQDYTYSMGIAGTDLTGPSGSNDIGVTYNPTLSASGNTGGTDTELLIGGTLTVVATQAVGAYAGEVVVTVAYE